MANELIEIEEKQPVEFFIEKKNVDDLVSKIREKVMSEFSDDTSTDKARKYIASLAYKVAQTKTAIDNAGKNLVAELKELPKKIDDGRKEIRDALDALKDEVRRPLTEWEEKKALEEARIAQITAKIESYKSIFNGVRSVADWEKKNQLCIEPDKEFFSERFDEAVRVFEEMRTEAIALKQILEKSELAEKLQKEKEEAERLEKIRLAAEEKAAKDAELAILKAKQAEEFAKKRQEEAEARAKLQAEKAEEERIKALEAAKLQAEKAAEEARLREVKRQESEAKVKADEEARKEADKNHKIRIYLEITSDLVSAGIPEEWAKACVKAVNQGKVRNIKVVL